MFLPLPVNEGAGGQHIHSQKEIEIHIPCWKEPFLELSKISIWPGQLVFCNINVNDIRFVY